MHVVLHIGLHKTGTTFLQINLKRNVPWLLARGVYYKTPDTPDKRQISHHPLIREFYGEDGSPERGRAEIETLLAEAAEKNATTLLISSEMLVGRSLDIDAFLPAFASHDVTAIAYLRRPDDLIVSAYNQIVRDETHRRMRPLSLEHRPYDASFRMQLSRWMRPGISLLLAPYDRNQWVGGTIVTDFLSMIGIDDWSGMDTAARKENSNSSLPSSLTEIIRLANHIPMSKEDHRAFVTGIYKLYWEKPDAFASYDILTGEERQVLRRELAEVMPAYRPYFREGFDESFLADDAAPLRD